MASSRGVYGVEALADREEVTIMVPVSGGLLLRERPTPLLERIMLVALSVALAWALALALLMSCKTCLRFSSLWVFSSLVLLRSLEGSLEKRQ